MIKPSDYSLGVATARPVRSSYPHWLSDASWACRNLRSLFEKAEIRTWREVLLLSSCPINPGNERWEREKKTLRWSGSSLADVQVLTWRIFVMKRRSTLLETERRWSNASISNRRSNVSLLVQRRKKTRWRRRRNVWWLFTRLDMWSPAGCWKPRVYLWKWPSFLERVRHSVSLSSCRRTKNYCTRMK